MIAGALISIITAVLLKRHFLDYAKIDSITGANVTDKIAKKYGTWFLQTIFIIPGIGRNDRKNINSKSPRKRKTTEL